MEELAAEILAAIPSIKEHQMARLMKDLDGKGVRSANDMFKVGAVDLVNALGTEKAKKVAEYFSLKRGFYGPNSVQVRTAPFVEVLEACDKLNRKLDQEDAERKTVYKETLSNADEAMRRVREAQCAALESVKMRQEESARAHEERLRYMRRPDILPVQRNSPGRRENWEERLELTKPPPRQDSTGWCSCLRRLLCAIIRGIRRLFP